jgi:hypothetical protein
VRGIVIATSITAVAFAALAVVFAVDGKIGYATGVAVIAVSFAVLAREALRRRR